MNKLHRKNLLLAYAWHVPFHVYLMAAFGASHTPAISGHCLATTDGRNHRNFISSMNSLGHKETRNGLP